MQPRAAKSISGARSVAVAGLLALAATSASAPALRAEPRDDLQLLLWPDAGAPARADHRGRGLTAADLRDRVVVVSFVGAECSITCAVRTLALDTMAGALPEGLRDRVVVLGIDMDPARGAGGRLRAFADGLVGPASRLRLLQSDAAGTAALAARLRYPARALPEPPPVVLLFDRRGQIAMTYGSDPLDGPRLIEDITQLESFPDGLDRPSAVAAVPESTL